MQIDSINAVLFIVLVVNFGLALLILYHGDNRLVKTLYSAMILVVFGWTLGMIFYRSAGPDTAVFYGRLLYFVASFTSTTFLFFCYAFPEGRLNINKFALIFIPLWNVIYGLIILFTNLVVTDVVIRSGQEKLIIWGPLYWIYIPHILGFFAWAYWHLYFHKVRKLTGLAKIQASWVFWGFFISGNIAFTTNLSMPSWGDTRFNWLGQITTVTMLGATAYAILKLHLLNIRLIIAETVTYLVLVALTIEALFSRNLVELLIKIIIVLILGYGGSLLIKGMKREIEQRRQLEDLARQLRIANQRLKELDEMKDEFISIAAHDLNTPIATIEGYLSMILDEKMVPIKNKKAEEYLRRVYSSSQYLATLVEDILNVSRIEQGRLVVKREPIDIAEVISSGVGGWQKNAADHDLELKMSLPPKPLPKVYADSSRIKQVINNLVSNAIKYSKSEGGTVRVSIAPTISEDILELTHLAGHQSHPGAKIQAGKALTITVQDEGIGIPKEELSKLFSKFYRVTTQSHQQVQGTGLGLFIAKSIIEMHNGYIWANSAGENRGTILKIILPPATADQLKRKPEVETKQQVSRSGAAAEAKIIEKAAKGEVEIKE